MADLFSRTRSGLELTERCWWVDMGPQGRDQAAADKRLGRRRTRKALRRATAARLRETLEG